MRNLIIGTGEIGTSLYGVLKEVHLTLKRDVEEPDSKEWKDAIGHGVQVLNICFPYGKDFSAHVRGYIHAYRPRLTIIHSTVPVGTTRTLGEDVVHSPIHGKHPDLEAGIRTFVKYVGGIRREAVLEAVRFLKDAGINAVEVNTPETSELSKICCTTRYGMEIAYMKEVERMCKKCAADFDMVYGWNEFYTIGYERLGMPHFRRSILKPMPGRIGGHCVIKNAELMPDEPPMKWLLERDKTYAETTEDDKKVE